MTPSQLWSNLLSISALNFFKEESLNQQLCYNMVNIIHKLAKNELQMQMFMANTHQVTTFDRQKGRAFSIFFEKVG
jgi:hypothetical protein